MIELLPWDETGLALLQAMNSPEHKQHLGGPETEAKMLDRHSRYLTYHQPGSTEMLRIVKDGQTVGSIGYWEIDRGGTPAYETGWEVLSRHHNQGVASAAGRLLIARLAPVALHREVYAFPSPQNIGSNALCQKLGFQLTSVEDVEYPLGVISPHNVWRLELAGFKDGHRPA